MQTSSEAGQEGADLEASHVLDITGSMGGQRITDLKAAAVDLVDVVVRDQQEPYYSKIALVPYSLGVNLGSNAAAARGPATPPASITAATWRNGDYVRITGVAGMTQINNKTFQVANRTANTFQRSGMNGSSCNTHMSGGTIQKC